MPLTSAAASGVALHSRQPAGPETAATPAAASTATVGTAPAVGSVERLERDIVTLPNKALRLAACELVAQAGAADYRSAASLYSLLYVLERFQVSLAWCDALHEGTLLASLPACELARHREARSSMSREFRGCSDLLEELCRDIPGPKPQVRMQQLCSRLTAAAARLLDRLFCDERMLYPPLLAEQSTEVLHGRAMETVARLDAHGPLGRRQLLEFLLRAIRAAEIPPAGSLLLR